MRQRIILTLAPFVLIVAGTRRPEPVSGLRRSAAARADTGRAFVLSSLSSTYPLAGLVAGRVQVGDDSIRVFLDTGVVRNRMPPVPTGATALDSIEIRAAVGTPDSGSWRVEAVGGPALLVTALAPGAGVVVSPTRLAVARPPGAALEARWLVFELRARHHGINGRPPGPLATYICSDRNLTGPTGGSATRAAEMARAYNRAC